MYQLHCTKKLLDRTKPELTAGGDCTTQLGNWYATVLFWKPQVALLVNERTLLPVLMPLAPATTLAKRFPQHLAQVLGAHGVAQTFIEVELRQMQNVAYAKTANRSVVGVMNQFAYHATFDHEYYEPQNLLALSLKLADTPCLATHKNSIWPRKALLELVNVQPR